MIRADEAIARIRRDLMLGQALRYSLAGGAMLGAFVMMAGSAMGLHVDGSFLLLIVGALWCFLSIQGMKVARLAASSPPLIAAGDFDEAERRLEISLRSFSMFRPSKLLGLHHLALLRHAQRRYIEAAQLCRELLVQRMDMMGGLSHSGRLILADALLEMGDRNGAWEAMQSLYRLRLALPEAMNLLQISLDYQSQIGAWDPMLEGVRQKVELAEIMPAEAASRSQALMALAAFRRGRDELGQWLRRRAELLIDPLILCQRRPILKELWPGLQVTPPLPPPLPAAPAQ